MSYFGGVGSMLIQALLGLALFLLVLRIALPLARARFLNPICQMVYKLTNPVLAPVGRFIPTFKGFNFAAALIAFLLCCLAVTLIALLSGVSLSAAQTALIGFAILAHFVLGLYFWLILVRCIGSFFSPSNANPAFEVLRAMTDPVLFWFRKIPPRLPALDLSPLWACLAIKILQYTLVYIGLERYIF